jgi:hypothetical protein
MADDKRPTDLPRRLRRAYRRTVNDAQQSVLMAWASFTTTFGITRAITYTLHREGAGGSGGIVVGGRHIHHYNFGIALLAAVGAIAVRGDGRSRHPVVAAAYGSGIALIVDELALLLDLKDVYWAKDGRTSVDAGVGLIGLCGCYLAAAEFWRSAGREVRATRRG